MAFDTPVLLLIFNRPDFTKKLFKEIKEIKPYNLFIAADGPRQNHISDFENCKAARDEVLQNIHWDCNIQTLLREENLGCKKAVSSGINWFFENVEQGIVLEDDTIPNQSFFKFTETVLNMYKDQQNIMHVAGSSFKKNSFYNRRNFYFSKYPFIWGWATWRRAWKNYDASMKLWPELKDSAKFRQWCFNKNEQNYWTNIFDSVYNGEIDTWDYQWVYSLIQNNGLCVTPSYNLISNIGFGEAATHTKELDLRFADLPTYHSNIKDHSFLKIVADNKIDKFIYKNIYNNSISKKQAISRGLIKITNKLKF